MTLRRSGLSLLEIIVAMAVLTGTATMLAQMISMAARHAERSLRISEAQTIAHNILSELLADIRPWETSETRQPVDPWSSWDYQIRTEPLALADLVKVTVTVTERLPDTAPGADMPVLLDQTQVTNARHYRLTRWVRRGPTAPAELGDFAPLRETAEP